MMCRDCDLTMDYHGIDDGGGDFGNELTEIYICWQCGREEVIEFWPEEFANDLEENEVEE